MQVPYAEIIDESMKKMIKIAEINETNMWELYDKKDGYIIYTKTNPENGIKINRSQTEIAYKADQIAELIVDVNRRPQYDEKVETAHVVEQIDNNTKVIYVRIKAPIPFMSSRDLVMIQRIYRNQDGSIVICAKSILHNSQPPIHKVERAEMSMSGWIITPQANGMTKIVCLQCFDPRGDVPQSVTNQYAKLQSEMMKSTVKFIASNYK